MGAIFFNIKTMNELERFNETIENIYIKKSGDKKIEELCNSLEILKDKFDNAVVVLTGGLNRVEFPSGQEHIKTEFAAHIREAAATSKYKELLAMGSHPVILISGGKLYGKGDTQPVLSEIMKTELVRKYGINPEDILTEPFSVDTSQNARFCSKLLETLGFSGSDKKPVYLITNRFHLGRATSLFNKHFGGDLKPVDAEQILVDFMQKLSNSTEKSPYKRVIKNYIDSQANQKSIRQDKTINAITKLPFGEKIIAALAYYLHLSEEKKEIPLIKQQRKK